MSSPGVINLNFGLSSLDSEEFASHLLEFADEIQGTTPHIRRKEDDGVKPKVQIIKEA